MYKRTESATQLVYSDGLVIKLAAHAAILALVVWAFVALPSGGALTLSDRHGHLRYENPLGIAVERRVIEMEEIADVAVRRARHSPGSGPPTLSSRVEIHLANGERVPLTRHYSYRRAEMSAIVHQVNRHLQAPAGELSIAYNDHKPAVAIAGFLGLYAVYAILWGIRQTTLRVDRDRGRISVTVRGLLARRVEAWALTRIAYVVLQIKEPDGKRRRVRPAIVLQNQEIKPIFPEYSSVSEERYHAMLEDVARFSGIGLRQQPVGHGKP